MQPHKNAERPVLDVHRKLNLIDALINADDEDPRAQHLGSRILLFRNLNVYGSVDVRDGDVWLSFYGEDLPLRVTEESVPAIVSMIENHMGSHKRG